jgi:hypothetical protein
VPDAVPPIDSRPAEGGADAALDASALDVLSGGASDLSASVDLPALDLSSEAGLPLDAAGIDAAGTYDLSIELDLPASPIDSGLAVDGL